ncbi:hypothetical protein FRC00_002397, partial [Tulasnella sp. 408]
MLQASSQVDQQPEASPSRRNRQFQEFFTPTFSAWLDERQLIAQDSARINGKEVELHKLFFTVGALGGCRAVSEKVLWRVVGAKLGLPSFDEPTPASKPKVAVRLAKIYERVLADFETYWYKSFRPGDPSTIFPLPPELQYLHPERERLAASLLPPQRQSRSPVERSPQQRSDDKARVPQSQGSLRQASNKPKNRKKRLEVKIKREFSDET